MPAFIIILLLSEHAWHFPIVRQYSALVDVWILNAHDFFSRDRLSHGSKVENISHG